VRSYNPVIRGAEALQVLSEIKGKFTDENIRKWRDVCCVNPDISNNNGSGICRTCPIAKPPEEEGWGWCHDWFEASMKLRLRTRLERLRKLAKVRTLRRKVMK